MRHWQTLYNEFSSQSLWSRVETRFVCFSNVRYNFTDKTSNRWVSYFYSAADPLIMSKADDSFICHTPLNPDPCIHYSEMSRFVKTDTKLDE